MLLVLTLLLAAHGAEAALTTDKCLGQKRQVWSTLRKCQATADVKRIKGKTADFAKCQTVFQQKHAKINAQAAKAAIACRFGTNGDGTITDYDTGLMWEGKGGDVGGVCFLFPNTVSHCVNLTFTPDEAQAYVSRSSADGVALDLPFLAGYADWRLPTIVELRTIVDTTVPGCGSGSPCIHLIFGPTAPSVYRSGTVRVGSPNQFWLAVFSDGVVASESGGSYHVRAVRGGL